MDTSTLAAEPTIPTTLLLNPLLLGMLVLLEAKDTPSHGVTDDTTAIQNFVNKYWGCKILFFDAGTYYVTNTITIPTGSIVVSEVLTTVIGGGSNFSDQNNPKLVIKVGNAGDKGVVEISNMVFSAHSGSAGAVFVDQNIVDTARQKATAAMWDIHIRLGGFSGSGMQTSNCLKQADRFTPLSLRKAGRRARRVL